MAEWLGLAPLLVAMVVAVVLVLLRITAPAVAAVVTTASATLPRRYQWSVDAGSARRGPPVGESKLAAPEAGTPSAGSIGSAIRRGWYMR